MNLGENGAVAEAMLHLSRPHYPHYPTYQTAQSTPNNSSSAMHSLPPLQQQQHPPDITSRTTNSPSLSPVRHKSLPAPANIPTINHTTSSQRPRAMRLSQLLTHDSHPTTYAPQHHHQPSPLSFPMYQASPYSHPPPPPPPPPLLPLAPLPVTEPVTPPFSPLVLPLLPPIPSVANHVPCVRTIPPVATVLPASTAPPPLVSRWVPNTVLSSRENVMPNLVPASAGATTAVTPATPATTVVSHRMPRPTTDSVRKIVKRPYKKYYSNPTPSSHCHVCARTSKAVKFAICARISEGLCRKVTCYKCFAKFGWDWESAVNNKSWICVHCRGVCPEGRSQCYIYSRVNSKRESKRGIKKAAKQKQRMLQQGPIQQEQHERQLQGHENRTGVASQNTSPGARLSYTGAPQSSSLPSVAMLSGQGVTSFSDRNAIQQFIRTA